MYLWYIVTTDFNNLETCSFVNVYLIVCITPFVDIEAFNFESSKYRIEIKMQMMLDFVGGI